MSLSDLASLGSFVSGVAVLISLIYLSLQIRQATKHSRAAIGHNRATRIVDIIYRQSNPTIAALMVKVDKGEQDLDEIEFFQFINVESARFFNAEDTFIQHRNGLLEDAVFQSFVLTNQNFMETPSLRAAWKLLRPRFDPGFAAFMDGIVQEGANRAPADMFAQWPSMVAEERKTQMKCRRR